MKHYITEIDIKKIRHLKDIAITLSQNELQHRTTHRENLAQMLITIPDDNEKVSKYEYGELLKKYEYFDKNKFDALEDTVEFAKILDSMYGYGRKHLILTGKNGSGKTSVLEAMRDLLLDVENGQQKYKHKQSIGLINRFKQQLSQLESKLKENLETSRQEQLYDEIEQLKQKINDYGLKADNLNLVIDNDYIKMELSDLNGLPQLYESGKFILAYFGVDRTGKANKMLEPRSPDNYDPAKIAYRLNYSKANSQFLQYLVNLKTQKAFAASENTTNSQEIINKVDKWFEEFEELLRTAFGDDKLILDFDYPNYKFYVKTHGRDKVTLNELSDGYLAIIDIITELILRMEKNKVNAYDVEGIVLIDEVEIHLHVELQKNILPLLTTFFPKVQFIVTTHSPFVLSSIEDAVIYDLEKQILLEDLSAYSWSGIVERYFDSDNTQQLLNKK